MGPSFSPFAQHDFLFQANHQSHVFDGKIVVAEKVQLHIWVLVSEFESGAGGSRFDINTRF